MKRVVTVSAVVLAAAVAACSRSNVHAATGGDVPSVAAAPVTRGDVSQVLTIAAEFRPYQEIDVHAKVAGYLQKIPVDVGDHVTIGPARKSNAHKRISPAPRRPTPSRTWPPNGCWAQARNGRS